MAAAANDDNTRGTAALGMIVGMAIGAGAALLASAGARAALREFVSKHLGTLFDSGAAERDRDEAVREAVATMESEGGVPQPEGIAATPGGEG